MITVFVETTKEY